MEITENSATSITIDISKITDATVLTALKTLIGYQDTIPDPNNQGQTITNPTSLLRALVDHDAAQRKAQIVALIKRQKMANIDATVEALVNAHL